MRGSLPLLLATLSAALLAGCALPGAQEEKEEDPLFGLCPQWVQGPGALTSGIHLTPEEASRETAVGLPGADEAGMGGNGTFRGRSLDLYRVRIDNVTGDGVQMRAFAASGEQLAIRDYRMEKVQMVPVAWLGAAAVGKEFDIHLTAVSESEEPAPGAITLRWSHDGGDAEVAFTVTYHYRVCGA